MGEVASSNLVVPTIYFNYLVASRPAVEERKRGKLQPHVKLHSQPFQVLFMLQERPVRC